MFREGETIMNRAGRAEIASRTAFAVLGGAGVGAAVLSGAPLGYAAAASGFAAGLAGGLWWGTHRRRASAHRHAVELDDARRLRNWIPQERLGAGSMGEVWRAEHRLLPRPAAVKFIRPEALGAEDTHSTRDAVRRFEVEARTTALLTSPHTIELYDFGVSPDGSLCYVMEFLEGMDLETLVERHGPLPPARVVHLLRQVCISLAEAHLQEFVHRDLKPANIYACRQGIEYDFAKVLDFGMVADVKVDDTQEIVGTPAYLAPEMVTGRFDARADIYSLGCVAYKLLTGCNVFDGECVRDVVAAHVHDRPTAPSLRTDLEIPRDLELVVMECLKKSPIDRIPSAVQLSKRLAACNVGARWTPGRAMQWWRDVGRGATPTEAAPAESTERILQRMDCPRA